MTEIKKSLIEDYIRNFDALQNESEAHYVHNVAGKMLKEDLEELKYVCSDLEDGTIDKQAIFVFNEQYRLYQELFQSIKNKEAEILNALHVEDNDLNQKLYLLRDILTMLPKARKTLNTLL
ncbi:hypothetical protein QYS48_16945 [Marivirga arenosa]|uniref:Uncharacterized protein n=1 Tax=Marivirga arenosa TaxID=3059076 RepID=A0AA49GHF0_9BACT|nr:hypothetical protein [Marivirga sp. ABR2-2]WKK83927.2 hypothetical protein QYS48_16945 [Marivirga sp. ABR2-2]